MANTPALPPGAAASISKTEALQAYMGAKAKMAKEKARAVAADKRVQSMTAGATGWALGLGATGALEGYFKAAAIRDGLSTEEILDAGRIYGVPYTAIGAAVSAIAGGTMQFRKPSDMVGKGLLEAGKAGLAFHGALYAATLVQETMLAEPQDA